MKSTRLQACDEMKPQFIAAQVLHLATGLGQAWLGAVPVSPVLLLWLLLFSVPKPVRRIFCW